MKKVTFHVISHTHWDREWYLSFETYRIELVDLIDNLLDVLEQNSDFIFHLDGYTLLIDDYLEIKPHNKKLIKKYIKSGNILTGPWYVLSDQFLTSGESTIRNLYYGISDATSLGNVMQIGYLPDQFGHIAQLPQILKGFNINAAILARGIQSGKAEHAWHGLNNDVILAISLTHWYNNAQKLPFDNLNEYLNKIYNKQEDTTQSGNILLMNGCDHLFVQPNLPAILKSSENHQLWTIKQSKLPDVIKSILDKTPLSDLPPRYGELRDDNDKFILASTLSSRIYLKLKNYSIQTQLEKIIEPLSSILEITNKSAYPYYQIKHAWKSLLQNHAHDSICGCSIDEVHREMETRFSKVNQLLDRLEQNLYYKLAKDTELPTFHLEDKKYLQLINLTNIRRNESIEVELEFPLSKPAEFTGAEKSSTEPKVEKDEIRSLKIVHDNNEIDFIVLDNYKLFKMVSTRHEIPALQVVQIIKLLLKIDVEPFSIKSCVLKTNEDGTQLPNTNIKLIRSKKTNCNNTEPIKTDLAFENDNYTLSINNDGTLDITLRGSGQTFKGLHFLTLENDYGDLYRFIPKDNESIKVFSSKSDAIVKIISNSTFEKSDFHCYVIEENSYRKIFVVENKSLMLHTKIICYQNCDRIDFKTRINSTIENQRLRLHFPTGVQANFITADTPFGTLERKRPPKEWRNPATVQPLHNWIDHSNEQSGLSFFGGGLAEYELYESGNGFTITLIRAIGKLSIVKSHSLIETPEGQCKRDIEFNYALLPHIGNWETADIANKQLCYQTPIKTNQSNLPFHLSSFIHHSDDLLITTFKKAERKENLYVVRLFNPKNKQINDSKFAINFTSKKIYLLNLNEEIIDTLAESKNNVTFNINPYQIITLGIEI